LLKNSQASDQPAHDESVSVFYDTSNQTRAEFRESTSLRSN
jgi:hypothetical protein